MAVIVLTIAEAGLIEVIVIFVKYGFFNANHNGVKP
jgi:hypothetical protein